MPQLLLDLRTSKTYSWNSAVILYDDTLSKSVNWLEWYYFVCRLGRDQVTRVVKAITADSSNLHVNTAAVSLIKLETRIPTSTLRKSLRDVLSSISIKTVGGNFLAIVGFEIVELMMEFAKSLGLVNTRNQWLYVIPNTRSRSKEIDRFKQLLTEGDNVAFLYNSTVNSASCTVSSKHGRSC
jgi:ionotropic glutamate receptor